MQDVTQPRPVSGAPLWAGRIMTTLAALFLLFDGVMKLVKPGFVVEATLKLGYSESTIIGIGVAFAGQHDLVPRSADRSAWRHPSDGLPWRSGRFARARG